MATALDLIKGAMRLIGAIESGETPSSEESSDGLSALNAMLDAWSVERLMVYQILQEPFSLSAGTASYTIGSGGTWNTARPVRIDSAFIRDSDGLDYPIEIITKDRYDAIADKTTQSRPEWLYYYTAYPLGTIYWYSVPDATYTAYLNSWKQLQSFAGLATDLALPPGYERAIKYNLALEIAPEYNRMPSAVVVEVANESKAALKSANAPVVEMKCDVMLVAKRSNILADA